MESEEMIYSPKSQMKYSSDTAKHEETTTDKCRLTERFRNIISNIKNSFNETLTKIQIRIQEKKEQKNKNDQPRVDSNIFVTSSSLDFHKIKADEKFVDYHPQAYPIIGACVIAFPYAFKEAGFPLGLILLIATAIMVDYSELLLVQCSIMANETCLQNIAKVLFGNCGFVLSYAMPYLYSLSVLLTYNVILADTCTKVVNALLGFMNSEVEIHRRIILLMLTLIIIIPISMTTNVKRIFKWSLVSLVSASFVTVFVAVKLFTLSNQVPQTYNAFKFLNINLLQAVAVMTFALSCQHTCRLYYATIDQNKEFNSSKPANIASSYSLLCTLVLGICGYLTFKGVTQGNLLENYCEEDLFATVARMFYAGFILCLFPLECQAMRHLLQQTVVVHKKFQNIFNVVITLLMLAPAFIVALFVDCLSIVLEVAGLLFAIPLVFILPAIFFVRLSPGTLYSTKKLPCLICIATGSTITICGLTMTIFSGHHCVHLSKMFPYCNGSSELLGPLITLISLNGTSNFDPQLLGFNLTNFDSKYTNLTDFAAAYFT